MAGKYKHVVISRVAIKYAMWNLPNRLEHPEKHYRNLGRFDWNEWVSESVVLYDKYCRNSLKKQTNDNFILLSLFDENINYVGDVLPNECIIKIKRGFSVSDCVYEFLSNYSDLFLTSRIDRDDCYSSDFVEVLQGKVDAHIENNGETPYFFDTDHINTFDGTTTTSFKYWVTSPFVSVLTDNIKKMYVYSKTHGKIKDAINGEYFSELETLQIIHDHNVFNCSRGEEIKLNLKNFGLCT